MQSGIPNDTAAQLEQALLQLYTLLHRSQQQAEKRLGITVNEIEIMRLLESQGERKMKDIGLYVGVKLSNLTNIIDRMEGQKLVRRATSKQDRRAVLVELTAKGRKALGQYHEAMRELAAQMQAKINPADFPAFLDHLQVIGSHTTAADEAGEAS